MLILVYLIILFVHLFNLKVNDPISERHKSAHLHAPFCMRKQFQLKSNDLIIEGMHSRAKIDNNKNIYVSINSPMDKSGFCALENDLQNFRDLEDTDEYRWKGIESVFEPIRVYNISLVIFFDKFYQKRTRDVLKDIKYIIKGLQEIFTTYDVVNEIGLIKFYVIKIVRIVDPTDELVDTQKFDQFLFDYISREKIEVADKVIPVWLTGANIISVSNGIVNNVNRIEGVAKSNSFCKRNSIVIINCNSINKAQITLAHELAHVFGADHDLSLGTSKCDGKTFLMSPFFSSERSVLSACSVQKIAKKIKSKPAECFQKESNYEFGYEDIIQLGSLSLDEQCAYSYSRKFKSNQHSLNDSKLCEKLSCKNGFIELSNNYPVMNGTPCNQNPRMVCCFGECVLNCSIFQL